MRKTDFCLCENKDADQLCSAVDQHVCFHIMNSSIFFLYLYFQASGIFLRLYRPVCVGPFQKPRRPVLLTCGSFEKQTLSQFIPCKFTIMYEGGSESSVIGVIILLIDMIG